MKRMQHLRTGCGLGQEDCGWCLRMHTEPHARPDLNACPEGKNGDEENWKNRTQQTVSEPCVCASCCGCVKGCLKCVLQTADVQALSVLYIQSKTAQKDLKQQPKSVKSGACRFNRMCFAKLWVLTLLYLETPCLKSVWPLQENERTQDQFCFCWWSVHTRRNNSSFSCLQCLLVVVIHQRRTKPNHGNVCNIEFWIVRDITCFWLQQMADFSFAGSWWSFKINHQRQNLDRGCHSFGLAPHFSFNWWSPQSHRNWTGGFGLLSISFLSLFDKLKSQLKFSWVGVRGMRSKQPRLSFSSKQQLVWQTCANRWTQWFFHRTSGDNTCFFFGTSAMCNEWTRCLLKMHLRY